MNIFLSFLTMYVGNAIAFQSSFKGCAERAAALHSQLYEPDWTNMYTLNPTLLLTPQVPAFP